MPHTLSKKSANTTAQVAKRTAARIQDGPPPRASPIHTPSGAPPDTASAQSTACLRVHSLSGRVLSKRRFLKRMTSRMLPGTAGSRYPVRGEGRSMPHCDELSPLSVPSPRSWFACAVASPR